MKSGPGIGLILWVVVALRLSPLAAANAQEVIGRDGDFVALANGVVVDRRTGLEWIAGPDVDTSYYQAVAWVNGLTVDGGGWRMPTTSELATLVRTPGPLNENITPLLKTSGVHAWPYQDNEDLSLYLFRYMDPYGTRGLAVRGGTRR